MRIRAAGVALASAIALVACVPAAAAGGDMQALALLGDVVQGRDGSVIARLNPQMHASLNAAGLSAAWATYRKTFGRYLGHGSPQLVELGPLTIVRVPLRMSRQPGEFRVTFSSDGQIAGLYFLRTGVPI